MACSCFLLGFLVSFGLVAGLKLKLRQRKRHRHMIVITYYHLMAPVILSYLLSMYPSQLHSLCSSHTLTFDIEHFILAVVLVSRFLVYALNYSGQFSFSYYMRAVLIKVILVMAGCRKRWSSGYYYNRLRPFVRDYLGESVPEG